jgi:hypothetical protein
MQGEEEAELPFFSDQGRLREGGRLGARRSTVAYKSFILRGIKLEKSEIFDN